MSGQDDNLVIRGAIAGIGMLPIAALALALGGLISLSTSAFGVVLPIWLALAVVATLRPTWGRTLAIALVAGMIATAFYDVARLAMTWAGGLSDGIPNIGRLLLRDLDAPVGEALGLGYAYRYLGDGGGLALAFCMGRRYGARMGMAFGAAVCVCLWITLAVMPYAQTLLFPLTPYALVMTMVGHLIYGGTLGTLLARWLPAAAPAAAAPPTITLTVTEGPAPAPARELNPTDAVIA